MNRNIMPAALVAASFIALMLTSSPTLAQSVHSERVSYGDLDLSREADVRIFDRRIDAAVKEACGPASDADPAGNNDVRRCRAETKARIAARRDGAIAEARQSVRTALAD